MKKEYFSLRKTKSYGLCGVALATVFLATGNVSADEVSSPADATPNVTMTGANNSTSETVETPVKTAPSTTNEQETVNVIREPANIPAPEVKEVEPVISKNDVPDPKVSINNETPKTPVEDAVKTHKNEVTAGTEGSKSATASVTAKSTTKTETTETTKVEHEPMDLIAIVDHSGSTAMGKRDDYWEVLEALINRDLTEQDKIQISLYYTNDETSYSTDGTREMAGVSTKLLSKQEALQFIAKINSNGNAKDGSISYIFPRLDFADYLVDVKAGFEEIYMSQQGRNKNVSVIQFTDQWEPEENIDTSFANWATSNAKTFMTVVGSGYGSPTIYSVDKMNAVGHPNVYVADGDLTKTTNEVIKQFQNTAVVKKETSSSTTTSPQSVEFVVNADSSVKLTSVKLTRPDGKVENLTISNNTVTFKQDKAPDGEYKITYDFSGNGNITVIGKVDGKEVVNKTDNVAPRAGQVVALFVDESGKELAARKTIASDTIGKQWSSSDVPTEITKEGVIYRLASKPDSESGQLGTESVTLKYIYTPKKFVRNVSLRVVNALDGTEIQVPVKVASGWQGEQYSVNAPNLEGWKLYLDGSSSLTGTYGSSDSLITYLASQNGGTVTARFTDAEGKELLPTKLVSQNGSVGDAWALNEIPTYIEVDGKKYLLASKPNVSEGKVTVDDVLLPVSYVRESAGTVIAKFVGTDGVKLAEDMVVSKDGFTSDNWKVTEFPKELIVDGKKWLLSVTPSELEGVLSTDNITLVFEYKREAAGKVTVKFVDENGREIAKEIIVSEGGFTGDSWKYEGAPLEIEFEGKTYVLTLSPETLEGLLTTEDVILTFVYKEKVLPTKTENTPMANKPQATSTRTLPNTGSEASALSAVGILLATVTSSVAFIKKRKDN